MKFEYSEMRVREGRDELIYEMDGKKYYDLMTALNEVGLEGWELVLFQDKKYIFKRLMED